MAYHGHDMCPLCGFVFINKRTDTTGDGQMINVRECPNQHSWAVPFAFDAGAAAGASNVDGFSTVASTVASTGAADNTRGGPRDVITPDGYYKPFIGSSELVKLL